MAVAAVRIVSLPQRELRKARLAKRAVDCALVIGFGAAYGAGSLIRPGWLQFFFKPEGRAVARLVHPVRGSGRADAVLFYDIPAMTGVRIETY